ncbi:MAG: DsbA family protein [SAR324 cluster bacterium]|nr:DsbA family protein [SAR324 cluster bacterium]MCZ6628047.1 DsbA family protein [SAR324 cluster bacterium]MCZ6841969.1 DsbA family protein [SAR324 cluster bacterium]
MAPQSITAYFDYKSPFAYLAKDLAYQLAGECNVSIDWLPYTLNIPEFLGDVETRGENDWAKIKYLYMDARRLANKRGLIVRGPQKIFDTLAANIGMLYAEGQGKLRPYHDLVFERFFLREFLDIEQPAAVQQVLQECGVDASGYPDFLAGAGREMHDRILAEARAMGVFGVPTFVWEGEMFWGTDRMDMLRERIAESA